MSRKIIILVVFIAILLSGCAKQAEKIQLTEEVSKMEIEGVNIQWLGHSGFVFKNEKIIYIDPFKISGGEKADLILITHEHYDHCSVEDIKKIIKPSTIIVTVADCQSKVSGMQIANVTLVKPGDKVNVQGTMIEAVHAYNVGKKFHPKENEWVGFIVTINNKRIYHAGDTDNIPEINNLENIDIALVPVSGTYVMTAEEAAKAVNEFKPKVAIPMHYGSGIVGTKEDAEKFKSMVSGRVEILG